MKKSVLLGILGIATCAATSFGQGVILLDNYNSSGPIITFGANVPLNGVAGPNGVAGTGLPAGWTAGLYIANGNLSLTDPSSSQMPIGTLTLGTGNGSTATFFTSTFGTLGEFLASAAYVTGVAAGSPVTLEIVAYPTAAGSYAAAQYRGHSTPFTMNTFDSTSPSIPPLSGLVGFSVTPVPEPTTLALAGLGGLALLAFRRKQS